MNIFILSLNPKECAKFHCDKHVVKMILETVQLLYCAHWILQTGNKWIESCQVATIDAKTVGPYKQTHKNHPCSIWARESVSNYNYLATLGMALCEEYTYRYGKVHNCQYHLNWLIKNVPKNNKKERTEFPQAITNTKYRVKDDPVQAYRNYYKGDKSSFAKWTKRKIPNWFK